MTNRYFPPCLGKGLCPESCPENYRPVCGNDGILYVNECELRLKACKTKKMKELKRSSKKICRKYRYN